ncbi:hypothetical protein H6F87_26060 [Cyanobacteria bacterium FACHB-502]|nr:hypothetical protein [Cyanobacteria bacterium FACHB-502]
MYISRQKEGLPGLMPAMSDNLNRIFTAIKAAMGSYRCWLGVGGKPSSWAGVLSQAVSQVSQLSQMPSVQRLGEERVF